jgi:hypothetical protein
LKFSKDRIAAIKDDYVKGVDGGGVLTYLPIAALAEKHGTGKRVISKFIARDGWHQARQEYARAFDYEQHRAKILDVLSDVEKSNGTDLSLAKLLGQHVLRLFANAHESEQLGGPPVVLTASQLNLLGQVIERAQKVKRLAYGQATSIVEQREKTQAELTAHQEAMLKTSSVMSDEERVAQLASLSDLPVAQMLKAWGLHPAAPKPAKTAAG